MKKTINRLKLFAIFAMAAIIVISGVACGSEQSPQGEPTTPAQPQSPTGNQPPVISSLTPANIQVSPSGISEIQIVVEDPDGDSVNIKWSATGGTFSGSGYVVTWQAPKQIGTYDITATVDDGKGASAQSTVALSVVANQNPQISSVTADPATTGPGGSSTITCIASDPDGDALNYTWQATEGNITGVGNKVSWFAPSKGGSFNVSVIVNDGKGGKAQGNVAITVATSTRTVTINVIAEETGTVSQDGDKDTSVTKAGDDANNMGYRSFWSFNIFSLQRNDVKDAKLIFTTKNIIGDPFKRVGAESLGGLRLWKVVYSDKLPQFNIIGGKLQSSKTTGLFEQPTVLDVTPEVSFGVQNGATRFQVEALFTHIQNANNISEMIEWSDVKLEVTFTERK
jgi:hypothetical protein